MHKKDEEAIPSKDTIDIIKNAFAGGRRTKTNSELAALTGKSVGSIRGLIHRLGLNKGLPSAIPIAPHPKTSLTLMELGPKNCRAVVREIGKDRWSQKFFCGALVVPGSPYCPHHKNILIQKPRPIKTDDPVKK